MVNKPLSTTHESASFTRETLLYPSKLFFNILFINTYYKLIQRLELQKEKTNDGEGWIRTSDLTVGRKPNTSTHVLSPLDAEAKGTSWRLTCTVRSNTELHPRSKSIYLESLILLPIVRVCEG
jgi:hypothetical protein